MHEWSPPGLTDTELKARPPTEGSVVLAPRVTRVAGSVVIAGILIQAAIAGGFLAGYAFLTAVHMLVGVPLIVSSLVLVAAGLVRRNGRREPASRLLNRLGVLVTLIATALIGMIAAGGVRDLLIVHVPLALIGLLLATRLVWWAVR